MSAPPRSVPEEAPQRAAALERPDPVPIQSSSSMKKKRNHRGGKKKRTRKQSFAAGDINAPPQAGSQASAARTSFYRLQGRNISNTSLESEALLDHRDQQSMRPRRQSTMGQSAFGAPYDTSSSYRPQYQNPFRAADDDDEPDERAPLLSSKSKNGFGDSDSSRRRRPSSRDSSRSKKKTVFDRPASAKKANGDYNVNYPPSMPGSPTLADSNQNMSFGDLMSRDDFDLDRASPRNRGRDDISEHAVAEGSMHGTSRMESGYEGRRHTIALQAEEDVCFPLEGMSEIAEDEMPQRDESMYRRSTGVRRRRSKWPDLAMLDDWSRFEKEGRSDDRRPKMITEPQLIGGRLRPIHRNWHRAEDDAPYRFTYFNEDFQSTIHSQTISELVQPGSSFRELFIPDPPELSDTSESEEEDEEMDTRRGLSQTRHISGHDGDSKPPTPRQGSVLGGKVESRHAASVAGTESKHTSGDATPNGAAKSMSPKEKPKRYGDRPTWWLDVLSPTDAEMKVIAKTFGIHPLTTEDIMMQEAREKVELFRHYYFVNYRSFEQDMNNEDFLEPVNMYVVVFREGVISFHFSMTPHPANVRRRVRQLKDYLILSSDWISYAIIDDITDAFAPLIQSIEDEVDDIDDAILRLHSPSEDEKSSKDNEKRSNAGDPTSGESGGDMLRRVGDCRKKVMGLYRLLGNKADVIKGFAKRCNEQWDVAPRSEIGLYLGDIQDHIVTMTGNLSHYEKILARSHGNYLAQINIKMNERQEQTADVLGKLTVLGTIVLPMNIITGLWGMNVWVPGQEYEGDLVWFWCLTAGLLLFGFTCFFIAKRVYRIV
ncbi:hypothetical protein B0J14DRAFT_605158 [Halenospora varia]|nr:hypothetical protein B0J14DRAFT_605158 [Halenospora varia]